jgi:hypothetical protein
MMLTQQSDITPRIPSIVDLVLGLRRDIETFASAQKRPQIQHRKCVMCGKSYGSLRIRRIKLSGNEIEGAYCYECVPSRMIKVGK